MPIASQHVARFIDHLKTSIWFVPAATGVAGVILAALMLRLDRSHSEIPWAWLQLLQIGADGVRQVFAVTTGSMMTITGVTFSISIVALTLASNQFGPKILRNYMSDSSNKFVLGLLVGTFLYGLTILAFIDGQAEGFIPLFATLVNLALSTAAIGGMIYFIHNISKSIQAEQIIAMIGRDLDHAIDRTLRNDLPRDDEPEEGEWERETGALERYDAPGKTNGYVQAIDYAGMAAFAKRHDCYVEVKTRAGKFAIANGTIAHYYRDGEFDDSELNAFRAFVVSGRERTPIQDIEFAIDQLVQVALRALSPGINDPYTAMTCVDWLSAALARMSVRAFPASYVRDADGTLRIVADSFTFSGAVNAVFDPLRQNARGNEMVVIRLLEALAAILEVTSDDRARECLMKQAELIYRSAKERFAAAADLEVVKQRLAFIRPET